MNKNTIRRFAAYAAMVAGAILPLCAKEVAAEDAAGPEALRFERVWEGRNVFDADIPFPDGVTFVPGAEYRGEVRSLPAAMRIVERGYAALAFWNGDIAPDDSKGGCSKGVHACWAKKRTAESWGALSAWAWGASRVMDWIETEPILDAKHVAVVGHSRGGKTALVAGVYDRRFAMACSNCSGCSGAKLNHIVLPKSESIARISKSFPHWFCLNYANFAGREFEMDFDQHEFIALIAPRLVCVASATKDAWAGQTGEWWAAKLASPAWELYG